jgi:hypothetical protein
MEHKYIEGRLQAGQGNLRDGTEKISKYHFIENGLDSCKALKRDDDADEKFREL